MFMKKIENLEFDILHLHWIGNETIRIEDLKKINKHFTYTLEYLGQYDIKKIQDTIKIGVSVNYESIPMIKLGDEIRDEIYKIKEQRPITFGDKYNKKSTNKLEIIPN